MRKIKLEVVIGQEQAIFYVCSQSTVGELKVEVMQSAELHPETRFAYALSVLARGDGNLSERVLFDSELLLDCLFVEDEALFEGMSINSKSSREIRLKPLILEGESPLVLFELKHRLMTREGLTSEQLINYSLSLVRLETQLQNEAAVAHLIHSSASYPVSRVKSKIQIEELYKHAPQTSLSSLLLQIQVESPSILGFTFDITVFL